MSDILFKGVCIKCGKNFNAKNGNRKTCESCYKAPWKPFKEEIKCKVCGEYFLSTHRSLKKCENCRSNTNNRAFTYKNIEYKNHTDFCRRNGIHCASTFSAFIREGDSISEAIDKMNKINDNKRTIEACHELAKDRGGECLETEYISSKHKMRWRCHNGHEFEKMAYQIEKGAWCKYCHQRFHKEETCRVVMEGVFGESFPKGFFFDWLINEDGNKMESDGYCDKLGYAFEFHGTQHFKLVKRFRMTEDDLERRKRNDQQKKDLYQEHGIEYFEITYMDFPKATSSVEDCVEKIRTKILLECKSRGISVPYPDAIIDIRRIFVADQWRMKYLRKEAEKNNIELLDDYYLGQRYHYHFRCHKGHKYTSTMLNIKQSIKNNGCVSCPECIDIERKKKGDKNIRKVVKEKGGQILKGVYENVNSKFLIRCMYGHKWETSYFSIVIQGSWCSKCNNGISIDYEGKHYDSLKQFEECRNISIGKIRYLMKLEDWTFEQAVDYILYDKGRRKSKVFECEICGDDIVLDASYMGVDPKYCIDCRPLADHQRYKDYAKKQREERIRKKKEEGWYCSVCGEEMPDHAHGLRFTCDNCISLSKRLSCLQCGEDLDPIDRGVIKYCSKCRNDFPNGEWFWRYEWTEGEDSIIIRNSGRLSTKDLASLLLGRTEMAVAARRLKLGIKLKKFSPKWSDAELEILRKKGPELTCEELHVLLPNRTVQAIEFKRKQIGVYWTAKKKRQNILAIGKKAAEIKRALDHSLRLEDLDEVTKQVLLGSLFGGGSITKKDKTGYILSIGRYNEEYLNWKMDWLLKFRPRRNDRNNKLSFETPRHPIFKTLYDQAYARNPGKSRVNQVLFPRKLLSQLGHLGWLIWYLDNGSANHLNLTIGRASLDQFQNVIDSFESFYGVEISRNKNQTLNIRSVRNVVMPIWLDLFEKHKFPESMYYKLEKFA